MLAAFPVPLLWSWGLPCTPQSTTVIPLECCSGLSLKEVQLRLLMQALLARGAEPCSVLLVSPSGLLLTDGLSPGMSLSPGSARAGGRGAFLAPGLILLFRGAGSCCSHPPWKCSRKSCLVFISHQHQPKGRGAGAASQTSLLGASWAVAQAFVKPGNIWEAEMGETSLTFWYP